MGVVLKQDRAYLLEKGSVEALIPFTMELCKLAGLDYDTEGSFQSLPALECTLKLNIHVLEARQGNKVVRVGTGYDKDLYIYAITEMIDGLKQHIFMVSRTFRLCIMMLNFVHYVCHLSKHPWIKWLIHYVKNPGLTNEYNKKYKV